MDSISCLGWMGPSSSREPAWGQVVDLKVGANGGRNASARRTRLETHSLQGRLRVGVGPQSPMRGPPRPGGAEVSLTTSLPHNSSPRSQHFPVPTKPYRWGYSLRATC